jgi:hypothetical protein
LILASGTVAGTAAGVMTGWVMEQLRPAEIEAMCPLAEVVAALDGQTVYKVKTCEGATIWLQTPDLLSQGYP